MKKINEIQIQFYILLFLLMMNFADAKTFKEQVDRILDVVSNDYTKPIGGLIVLAIAVYMIKEKDRIKEIFVTCIIFIIFTMVVTNARQIADWF